MIQYLLIFALGFFAATLIVLIVAPAIGRRIATLTERRVRATAALGAAELRAEKDAARAVYAVENRRLSTELRGQRERLGKLFIERDELASSLAALRGSNIDLERRVDELTAETGGLRSIIRNAEERLAATRAEVAVLETKGAEGDHRAGDLSDRIERLMADIEGYKIDLATGETQIETLKSQIGVLRDERKKLREEVKEATNIANDLRNRLEREESRSAALDAKLAESIASLSDRDGALERRASEIERLQEKLSAAKESAATATKALKESEASRKELEARLTAMAARRDAAEEDVMRNASEEMRTPQSAAIAARIERLRARHGALVEKLTQPTPEQDDGALRDEIAEIAAMMVDLTAAREGPQSPIHAILAKDGGEKSARRPSLADRIRATMGENSKTNTAETR